MNNNLKPILLFELIFTLILIWGLYYYFNFYKQEPTAEYLFVQNAMSWELTIDSSKQWTLSLTDLDHSTIYFTNYPETRWWQIDTKDFCNDKVFEHPLNASVEYWVDESSKNILVVQLQDCNMSDNWLQYNFKLLEEDNVVSQDITNNLSKVSVFIDDIPAVNCWGTYCDPMDVCCLVKWKYGCYDDVPY